MDQLNDDCLLRIIKYLSFPDQIKLWKANNNCSERLNANIRWVWRHQSIYQWDQISYCLACDPDMMHFDPFQHMRQITVTEGSKCYIATCATVG